MKILFPILAILFLSSCKIKQPAAKYASKKQPHPEKGLITDSLVFEQRELLKEYALCQCLAWAGPKDTANNDPSISIYYDSMLYSDSISTVVDTMARTVVMNVTPIQVGDLKGKKPIFLNCLAFAKSAFLDSLVKTWDSFIFNP